MVYFQKQPGSQQNTQPRYTPRITSDFLCWSGVLTRLCVFDVWKKKKIDFSVPKVSEMGWLHPEPSHDRQCERSRKQIRNIVPFRVSDNKPVLMFDKCLFPYITALTKLVNTTSIQGPNTSSNTKVISYRKVQITDFNEPTSVHPVGSKSDWFPPLGGIKYAVFFLWERHF